MALKVLMFNWRDMTNPLAGGAEIYVHEVAKRFVKWGNEVTLVCGNYPHGKKTEEIDGLNIVRTGGKYTVYINAFFEYISKLKDQFDVVVESINSVPFFTPMYVKEPLVAIIYQWTVKEIFFQDQVFPLSAASFAAEWLLPPIYAGIPIITISESAKKDLAVRVPKSKICIAYPGVDESFLEHSSDNFQKLPSDVVIYLGRLKQYKGLETLVTAMRYVVEKLPNAKLLIVGRGDYESQLKRRVHEISLDRTVEFLGYVSEDNKKKLLREASVFVYPADYFDGGWSIACLEAMACGVVPVVSTSLTDMVSQGGLGFSFPSSKPRLLAKYIVKLLEDYQLWKAFSVNCRRWSKQFTWDACAKTILRFLEDAL